MPETERQQPTFRFGVFELNRATGELRKHGVKLKLQDQPAQILALLLEHPGEVVTREEIRKRLWPEQTYVDFDNAINSAIRKLRDVLGDSSENPRFLETRPRRGYRFIAPVSLAGMAPEIQLEPAAPLGMDSKRHRLKLWALTSVAISLVLLVATALWLLRLRSNPPAIALSVLPLNSSLGSETHPSFSPDGNQIAFTWDGPRQDNFDIYVQLIGGGEPLRLTSDPAIDISPAWSPDGRRIAFVRPLSEETSAVMVVPALGGVETKLTEIPNYDRHTVAPLAPPRLLAWSPDGEWLVIADSKVAGGGTGLVAYSIRTGDRRRLTETHPQYGDANPAFSPDGRMLAFNRRSTIDVSDLYVLAIDANLGPAGEPKRITFDNRWTEQPAWSSDGRTLIFASNRSGTSSLWRVPIDANGPAEPVPFAGDGVSFPAVSKQGQRLAYTRSVSDSNIWQVNVRAPGEPAPRPARVIASTSIDDSPDFSRDGRRVAFSSSRSGAREIWVAASDGSHPVQMTNFGRHSGTPRWSPDGVHILFDSNVSGLIQIYVVSAEGGRPRLVTSGASENYIPSWSHDGHWIYFCSTRTGRPEIWKSLPGGENPQQMTRNGGRTAFESWDGRWLYYRRLELVGPIWRMAVEGGAEEPISSTSVIGRNFTISGSGIYFRRPGNPASTIDVYRFETGTTETLFEQPVKTSLGLAVSPDDKRILYSQIDYAGTDIMVVDHYR